MLLNNIFTNNNKLLLYNFLIFCKDMIHLTNNTIEPMKFGLKKFFDLKIVYFIKKNFNLSNYLIIKI